MSKMFNAYIIKEMDSAKEKKQTYAGEGIEPEQNDAGEEKNKAKIQTKIEKHNEEKGLLPKKDLQSITNNSVSMVEVVHIPDNEPPNMSE